MSHAYTFKYIILGEVGELAASPGDGVWGAGTRPRPAPRCSVWLSLCGASCSPAAVGKSSIRTAFGGGPFHTRHDMTIGVEFDSKIVNVDGVPIRISLYDAVSMLGVWCGGVD